MTLASTGSSSQRRYSFVAGSGTGSIDATTDPGGIVRSVSYIASSATEFAQNERRKFRFQFREPARKNRSVSGAKLVVNGTEHDVEDWGISSDRRYREVRTSERVSSYRYRSGSAVTLNLKFGDGTYLGHASVTKTTRTLLKEDVKGALGITDVRENVTSVLQDVTDATATTSGEAAVVVSVPFDFHTVYDDAGMSPVYDAAAKRMSFEGLSDSERTSVVVRSNVRLRHNGGECSVELSLREFRGAAESNRWVLARRDLDEHGTLFAFDLAGESAEAEISGGRYYRFDVDVKRSGDENATAGVHGTSAHVINFASFERVEEDRAWSPTERLAWPPNQKTSVRLAYGDRESGLKTTGYFFGDDEAESEVSFSREWQGVIGASAARVKFDVTYSGKSGSLRSPYDFRIAGSWVLSDGTATDWEEKLTVSTADASGSETLTLTPPTAAAGMYLRYVRETNTFTGSSDEITFAAGDVEISYVSGGSSAAVPDATTDVKGKVELATTGEATTGSDATRAVTPAGLKASTDALSIPSAPVDASVSAKGIAEIATEGEADTGTDSGRIMTPALVARLIGAGRKGGTSLPARPVAPNYFVLTARDGTNEPGLYACSANGTWTRAMSMVSSDKTLSGDGAGTNLGLSEAEKKRMDTSYDFLRGTLLKASLTSGNNSDSSARGYADVAEGSTDGRNNVTFGSMDDATFTVGDDEYKILRLEQATGGDRAVMVKFGMSSSAALKPPALPETLDLRIGAATLRQRDAAVSAPKDKAVNSDGSVKDSAYIEWKFSGAPSGLIPAPASGAGGKVEIEILGEEADADKVVPDATEAEKGKMKIATGAQAMAGTNALSAIVPRTLRDVLDVEDGKMNALSSTDNFDTKVETGIWERVVNRDIAGGNPSGAGMFTGIVRAATSTGGKRVTLYYSPRGPSVDYESYIHITGGITGGITYVRNISSNPAGKRGFFFVDTTLAAGATPRINGKTVASLEIVIKGVTTTVALSKDASSTSLYTYKATAAQASDPAGLGGTDATVEALYNFVLSDGSKAYSAVSHHVQQLVVSRLERDKTWFREKQGDSKVTTMAGVAWRLVDLYDYFPAADATKTHKWLVREEDGANRRTRVADLSFMNSILEPEGTMTNPKRISATVDANTLIHSGFYLVSDRSPNTPDIRDSSQGLLRVLRRGGSDRLPLVDQVLWCKYDCAYVRRCIPNNAGTQRKWSDWRLLDFSVGVKFVVSATAPSSPSEGWIWSDTTADKLKRYDGAAWQEVRGNVKSDWNATSGDAQILNKPVIPEKATDNDVRLGTDDARFITSADLKRQVDATIAKLDKRYAPVSASISRTNPASLAENNLDGAKIAVSLANSTYDNPISTSDFSLEGAPPGTTIRSVSRTDDTTAVLTLSFSGDFDSNAAMRVVVNASGHAGYGNLTTGTIAVRAVVEIRPAKPTGLSASAASSTSISLTWTNPGDSTITSYQYQYKLSTATRWPTAWTTVSRSGTSTTTATVTGLTVNTTYNFRIRAVNDVGNSPASDMVTATPRAVPAKPTGLTATAISATRVNLSWTSPNDSTITSWQYRYKLTSASSYGEWTTISGSGATTTSAAVSSLTASTAYEFRIRAVNANGPSVASDLASALTVDNPTARITSTNPASLTEYNLDGAKLTVTLTNTTFVTVLPPAKPVGVAARVATTASVTLSWTDPADVNISSWQYRYKTRALTTWGSWTTVTGSTASTTTATVTGITPVRVVYDFQVRAVGTGGNSPESDTANAVPAAPTGLYYGLISSGEYGCTWDKPSDPSITGWQYKYSRGDWTSFTPHTYIHDSSQYQWSTIREIRAVNLAGPGPAATFSDSPG